MGIAITLAQYLVDRCVAYDVVSHPRTATASGSAEAAHIPGDSLAKAVVLESGEGFMVAYICGSLYQTRIAVTRPRPLIEQNSLELPEKSRAWRFNGAMVAGLAEPAQGQPI